MEFHVGELYTHTFILLISDPPAERLNQREIGVFSRPLNPSTLFGRTRGVQGMMVASMVCPARDIIKERLERTVGGCGHWWRGGNITIGGPLIRDGVVGSSVKERLCRLDPRRAFQGWSGAGSR